MVLGAVHSPLESADEFCILARQPATDCTMPHNTLQQIGSAQFNIAVFTFPCTTYVCVYRNLQWHGKAKCYVYDGPCCH